MEKLIYQNLLDTVLKDNPLHPNQHGFRRGMSCETALSTVLNRLEKSVLEPGGVSLSVFLDVQGAFDNVNPYSAIKAMKKRGFPLKMISWYSGYLLNRLNLSKIKGVTNRRLLFLGTPQGGILSPLIWNIVIDELLQALDGHRTKACCFADDTNLTASGKVERLQFARDSLQSALDIACLWASEQGLVISQEKSV